MARSYEIRLDIFGIDPAKSANVVAFVDEAWVWNSWRYLKVEEGTFFVGGRSQLIGGIGEEEHFKSLVKRIWKLNGGYCQVKARYIDLEDTTPDYETLPEDYEQSTTGAK